MDSGGVGLYLSDRLPFYGLYIAKNVLAVDPTRMTPAVRHNDGGWTMCRRTRKCCSVTILRPLLEQVRWLGRYWRRKWVTCQGMIWLLAGVVLAGAVQDFMVLFVSTRRDGRSLGELVKEEMGPTAGVIALVACFMIMVIILAVLAMIVVKALTHSPWERIPLRSPFRWRFLGNLPALSASGPHWRGSVSDWPGVPDFRHYLWRLGGRKSDLGTVL